MDFSDSCISEVSRQRGLLCGSPAPQKHDRPFVEADELDWRSFKVGRSETAGDSSCHFLLPHGEQMLSFSTTTNVEKELSYCNQHSGYSYLSNGGLCCGNSNMNMHGVLKRVRGPFTPSQWLELEHQALIYKYMVANSPIPANLLIPIRRSLSTSGFIPYAVKWGAFQLGYSGNTDPEPGRCRRTDGKKWRCSRNAVTDQKYCERHLNRGRYRSRKHVEGHNGQAAKLKPAITSLQSTTVVSGSRLSSSIVQDHSKSIPHFTSPRNAVFKRMSMNNEESSHLGHGLESLSILTSVNTKANRAVFPEYKQDNPLESTSTAPDFGLLSSNSSLNPRMSSFSDNISFVAEPMPSDSKTESHSLRHFIDEWPKTHSELSSITWNNIGERQSDRTQLSISIPVSSSDLSSSTSSNNEKLTLSPLHMTLGVGTGNKTRQQKGSWTPLSCEASMAGPLGEVLANMACTPKDQSTNCSASSSLTLLADGWDSTSHLESSPTRVLQKFSFDSMSSSNRSSPRIENHMSHDCSVLLSDELLGSIHVTSTTIPYL